MRVSERRQQYLNRAWQCQSTRQDYSRVGNHPYQHICQLPECHFGPHKCWCESLFDEAGCLYVQDGLWDVTGSDFYHLRRRP